MTGIQAGLMDYSPRSINTYVPAAQYAADVNLNGPTRVDFGSPLLADTDGILDAAAADDSGPYTYTVSDFLMTGNTNSIGELDGRYGRCLTAVGSAAGVTQNLTVKGRDYLGQPISKTVAMNGVTPVTINVAFKWLDSITIAVGAATETIDVGWSDELGLPYKAIKVLSEEADDAPVATLGTLTSPVLTDPATASTLEPRGRYNPQTTLDGSKRITGTFLFSNAVNASGNGGLYGIAHYFA